MSTLRVDNIKSRTGTVLTVPDSNTLAVTGIVSVTSGGAITNAGNLTNSGNLTSTGDLSVGGNATVTGSLDVSGGGSFNNPSGIITTGTLSVGTLSQQNAVFSGVVTATSFSGDGSALTGIDASSIKHGSNVKAQATATGVDVTGNLGVSGDATVTGNFTVNGTTTTINTATLQVEDATIDTRHGNSVVAGTGGLRVIQTTDGSGNVTASREIRYNHSTGKWEFTEDGSTFKNLGSGGMGFSYFCGSF